MKYFESVFAFCFSTYGPQGHPEAALEPGPWDTGEAYPDPDTSHASWVSFIFPFRLKGCGNGKELMPHSLEGSGGITGQVASLPHTVEPVSPSVKWEQLSGVSFLPLIV